MQIVDNGANCNVIFNQHHSLIFQNPKYFLFAYLEEKCNLDDHKSPKIDKIDNCLLQTYTRTLACVSLS